MLLNYLELVKKLKQSPYSLSPYIRVHLEVPWNIYMAIVPDTLGTL